MKFSFPTCGSRTGVSIRAVINALLKRHKVERAPTAHREKNAPQVSSGWDYRPREAIRRYAAAEAARAETAETLCSSSSAAEANNVLWFDFVNPDPALEDARTKVPVTDPAHASSAYD